MKPLTFRRRFRWLGWRWRDHCTATIFGQVKPLTGGLQLCRFGIRFRSCFMQKYHELHAGGSEYHQTNWARTTTYDNYLLVKNQSKRERCQKGRSFDDGCIYEFCEWTDFVSSFGVIWECRAHTASSTCLTFLPRGFLGYWPFPKLKMDLESRI